ncbi:hypothetical protein [Vibrio panuliri]|uniref:ASCH domain-containing protein n=1 Tax=Vibrio panuliri TaxID=1381081 RepID=A0ABX3FFI4_9VIBR|nr:hypothetical protein [Vibrio panuliri]KAB1460855.1 hypothetical protein F7O85_00325 [Vibrio panuliri]OLQ91661.1 hypothetical protein BIY20_09670 [Vibrio panuliri]
MKSLIKVNNITRSVKDEQDTIVGVTLVRLWKFTDDKVTVYYHAESIARGLDGIREYVELDSQTLQKGEIMREKNGKPYHPLRWLTLLQKIENVTLQ